MYGSARRHRCGRIGHPQAFFAALSRMNISVQGHPLPDHARLTAADISFCDEKPVLMTQKDAVKCRGLADRRHWAVRMDVEMSASDAARVAAVVARCIGVPVART
jgi:tetraacyldisaccharide 4'-kinase